MGLFTDGFKLLKKASEPLYKTPKSIQETIEIMAVAENGIFEVSKNKYSKCYRFQDINYTTATEDEQIGIFERYCKFLNSLDCNYKINRAACFICKICCLRYLLTAFHLICYCPGYKCSSSSCNVKIRVLGLDGSV